MTLEIDYSNAMLDNVGEMGLKLSDIKDLQGRAGEIHQDLTRRRKEGKLPFYDLPYQNITRIMKVSCKCEDQPIENVVVLGIGGSALGARALAKALLPPYHEVGDAAYRAGLPRLFVADNVDPDYFTGLLSVLDLGRTRFVAISKSGGTAEVMSQFLIARDKLIRKFGEEGYRQRMVAITDQEKGYLRDIVQRDGLESYPVPPGVGGRFSVMTPVGLIPAYMAGVDVVALLRGAANMDKACSEPDILANPAYLLAAILYLADVKLKRNVLVMMPYASSLLEFAEWFQQLWAESLGKAIDLNGGPANVCATPVRSLGATDQHSQLQLYMEGPRDKLIVFIKPNEFIERGTIPEAFGDVEGVGYLGGHSLSELIRAEAKASETALAKAGRPNIRLDVTRVDGDNLGRLMYMCEVATLFAGGLYNVNPLDQPGVEMGKKFAFSMMGRKGYDAEKTEVEEWDKKKVKYIL